MVAVPTKARNKTFSSKTNRAAKGSYVLLMSLPEERMIDIGSLGSIRFPRGHYAYVGSALGGLEPRLNRHLRTDKRYHWHIDYLLKEAVLDAIVTGEAQEKTECIIARSLGQLFSTIPGFGASDCRCRSHLFFGAEDMVPAAVSAFEGAGLEPRLRYVRGQY